MILIKVPACQDSGGAETISLRCPGCRQIGTFEKLDHNDLWVPQQDIRLGQRRCPNPKCRVHVFFALKQGQILVSYPPERIDFDASDIPNKVLTAVEEAISCHANQCFVASAIMVRKALEALCRDREATGDNLKARIRNLGTKIVAPIELLDGLDDLRLLGNDAAHFESLVYDEVGQQEVETAIEFTKEILKAVYQYKALLAKLRALKKSP